MSVLNKKYFLFCAVFLFFLLVPGICAAETVQYMQSGQNMSSNRLIISDFTVTSERPDIYPGDTLEMSGILTSEAFYPMLISLPDGLYYSGIDPDGDAVKAGGSYIGQFISPGESLAIKARLKVDEAGVWKIWPAYNAQNSNGIVQYNPEEWVAAEIYVEEQYVPKPDLKISDAGIAGTGDNGLERKFYYVVENTGPVDAEESISRISVNGGVFVLENPVGIIPAGESQKVFFTLESVSKGDTVTIILDDSAGIEELDEENNDWSFAVNLQNDNLVASNTVPVNEDKSVPVLNESRPENIVCYSGTTGVCCDVTGQFIVLGFLAVLMSIFSFALGYYYCLTKKCENEIGWMYAKLKRMEEGNNPGRDYGYISSEEVPLEEEIPEADELLKGKSGRNGKKSKVKSAPKTETKSAYDDTHPDEAPTGKNNQKEDPAQDEDSDPSGSDPDNGFSGVKVDIVDEKEPDEKQDLSGDAEEDSAGEKKK